MQMRVFLRAGAPLAAVAGLLTALGLCLPTRNPGGDAWYYAACARWGQELWQPHHLLFNAVGAGWLRLLGVAGPAAADEALPRLQQLNALGLGAGLLLLARLLRRAGAPARAVPAWLLLVGSCFGLLRFATDYETYLLPLLPALGASLAWARALAEAGRRRAGWLLAAGALATLACLLHQLLLWWALGLALGLRPWQGRPALADAACYALPALLVPVAYVLAAPAPGMAGALRFALHDYLSGSARVALDPRSLLLTGISLVRTLGQVHGYLLPLLRGWPGPLGLVAAGSAVLGWYGGLGGRGRPGPAPVAPPAAIRPPGAGPTGGHLPRAAPPVAAAGRARHLRRTHALIGLLHLLFAAQAAGNAEFMVPLPGLAAVALAGGRLAGWAPRRIAALGLALLGWNLAFGLLPAHCLDLGGPGPALRRRVLAEPRAWFVLRDPNPLRNQLHYFTGRPKVAARVVGPGAGGPAGLRAWVRARLAAGERVYTDALGPARPLDRAALTQGDPLGAALAGLPATRVDSSQTLYGWAYLTRLGR